MGRDVAAIATELVARFGIEADEEACRQLAAARGDERGSDEQRWISVVFFLARDRARPGAA